ncbi:unnamed protein product [Bursaphelenchus okinawaensis]|uniref:Uncharacterized protein n=1 Tax=Bursaphelenchus okinawaensis TaxID=465554 RepID=A0A811KTD0_9BILA|nr:unnamed protein product [Bursaphelenchus okinawaensis]CAG9112950.1 unnamed protein product [Bursaphelenchus okinawaensis]
MGNQLSEFKESWKEKRKEEAFSKIEEVRSKLVDRSNYEEKTGLERLKDFYDLDKVSLERYIVTEGTRRTFYITFIIGGLLNFKEVENRVELYASGKNFGSPRNQIIRKTDFKILQFMKNGFKYSLKCSFICGLVLVANTHAILLTNRFQYWYPPVVTGASNMLFQAALSGIATPLGINGIIQAGILGGTLGGMISSVMFLLGLYKNADSANDTYNICRETLEAEMDKNQQRQTKIRNYMYSEGISVMARAEHLLKQKEEEEKLNSGLDNISD